MPLQYIEYNCKNKDQQVKIMSYTGNRILVYTRYLHIITAEKTHLCLNLQQNAENARLYVRRTTTSVQAPAPYLLATIKV